MNITQHTNTKRLLVILLMVVLLFAAMPAPAYALTYPQVIILSAPERYYRLGEASGGAIDAAYGVSGSYTSATLGASGAIYDGDTAVEFSGATNGGNITLTGINIKNYSWAIEAWIYPMSSGVTANAQKSIARLVAADVINYYVKYISGVGFRLYYDRSSSTAFTTVLTADTWHHTLLQWSSTTGLLECYLDGTLIGSITETAYTGNSPTWTVNTATGTLGIRFDEYAIYHRVLTQGEINQHKSAAAGAIATATPTITSTPSATFTPSVTPTATNTPTATPGWDYAIELPTGGYGRVAMDVSAGEIVISIGIFITSGLLLGILYAALRRPGSSSE